MSEEESQVGIIIKDVFMVMGRGYILAVSIPGSTVIEVGAELIIDEEKYRIIFVERANFPIWIANRHNARNRNLIMGLGVGNLANDMESYKGKTIKLL